MASVPPSKLPDLIYQSKEDLDQHGILYTILGHVGDGAPPSLPFPFLPS